MRGENQGVHPLPLPAVSPQPIVLVVCADDGVRERLVRSLPPGLAVHGTANEEEAIDILRATQELGTGGPGGVPWSGVCLLPDGVLVAGTPVRLTRLEQAMVRCLLSPPGSVWSLLALSEQVWGTSFIGDGSQVRAVLKRLRRKLDAAGTGLQVESVRGRGLRLGVGGEREAVPAAQLPHNCPSVPVAQRV